MVLLKGKGQLPIFSFCAGYGDGSFLILCRSLHRPTPVRCNWSVFARKMRSTTKFAMTILSKCVCVWTICIDVKLLLVVLVFPVSTLGLQGAQAHCGYLCQRSYSTMGEAEIDHLRVPAPIFIFVNGDRLSQVPACRLVFPISIMDYAASEPSSELRCQQVSIHCTVFAI